MEDIKTRIQGRILKHSLDRTKCPTTERLKVYQQAFGKDKGKRLYQLMEVTA